MKKLFFWALAACAFAACSDDDPVTPTPVPDPPTPDPVVETQTVDFEAAQLGEAGFIWGKESATPGREPLTEKGDEVASTFFFGVLYTEKLARIETYYTDYGHAKPAVDLWSGFVVSNHTDRETAGYENDKSVYAESGYDGSKQFAVGYYAKYGLLGRGIPTITFRALVKPKSIAVAAATYPYLYYQTAAVKPAFDLVISGVNNRTEVGTVTVPLVVDGQMKEGWQMVDISELGSVSSLQFRVKCSDEMAPTYFCIDNLTYEK